MSKTNDGGLGGLERVLTIDGLLRAERYPGRAELARHFEVDKRTISRDLDFMRDRLGAPVEYHRARKGYYYTDSSYFLPDVSMTEGELLATFLAGAVVRDALDSTIGAQMQTAVDKLARHLPDKVKVPLHELSQRVAFAPRSQRNVDAENFQILRRAVNIHPVWIRYYSAHSNQVSERVIEPLHLRYHLGDWYLVAYCRLRCQLRTFAISRVHQAQARPGSLPQRPDFDAESYFASALGILAGEKSVKVRVWFAAERARWIAERSWHPSQQLEQQPDGSVILEMLVASTAELLQWVLGYGSEARVLEPAALADEVRHQAQQMLARYDE